MKSKALFTIAFLFYSKASFACSMVGISSFMPTLEKWEQHPGPGQISGDGPYWEAIPMPLVNIKSIDRGEGGNESSCGDAGVIELELILPSESSYTLEEFGVYFRIIDGELPDQIFPSSPVKGSYVGRVGKFIFAWLDPHPRDQKPLDFLLEVSLITNSLNIGPPKYLRISENAD